MASGNLPNPHPVIVEYGDWGAIGSVAANGGTLTVTKDLPTKAGYKTYLLDIHFSSGASGASWSHMFVGYTVNNNNTITITYTNNHTGALNPTPRYTVMYIAV